MKDRPPSRSIRERFRQSWRRLRGGSLSPGRAAASIALGLFVGCLPIYGFQLPVVLAVCLPLRLDAPIAYLAAHVSNPLTIVLVLGLELEVGSLLLRGERAALDVSHLGSANLSRIGADLAAGSIVVATAASVVGGAVAWVLVHGARDLANRAFADARNRTISRYRSAPRRVRGYVAGKLRTDPALALVAAEGGSFGRVVDAGSGFGQIALGLVELGRASSVLGFDADADRVTVANSAAEGGARFEQRTLEDAEFPEADTILFVDSLHYVPLDVQDRVLERAARALAPGGRILVREVNATRSLRGTLTSALERLAARVRRRPVAFGFRTAAGWVEALERLGLTCTVRVQDDLGLLENVLVVGTKR